jgi:hypothetical protein
MVQNLLFICMPLFNKLPSKLNRLHEKFWLDKGEPNTHFWNHHLDWKTKSGPHQDQKFGIMELAAKIPQAFVRESDRVSHTRALKWMEEERKGPFVQGGYIHVTLWKKYAMQFKNMMDSPLVMVAEKFHFKPVLLLKECFCQKTNYGSNGVAVHSKDTSPMSHLSLLGFYHQPTKQDDVNVNLLSLKFNGKVICGNETHN